ncbi:FecR family protein [Devosia sediminis]|uniref:FecR domain-containing protein n=1 Tax=Devosia sediminis TaxID=2798801 RepID=A0A934MJF9_9HYPH|nr:FecR family protein [Devosia sediminis]MBJ3784023.1 FecR domain-containing protein [Devosia sediminis]
MQVGLRWIPIQRGSLVQSNQSLRTGADGRVGLTRGKETIELGSDSEITLLDAGSELKTSVKQNHGTVTVDVERRNVHHFSVQTPFLAAVVKGTRFTVIVGDGGAEVDVDRGVVQVQDTSRDLVTEIRPGQQAAVLKDVPLNVSGGGQVAIFTFEGERVVPGTTDVMDSTTGAQRNSDTLPAASTEAEDRGPPAHANAGGNNNGNGQSNPSNGVNGNGPPEHSNGGENGNGDGPPEHSNAGGNGGGQLRENGPPAHSNAGGNGNGNGPPDHSNAGGNGKGNGRE